MKGKHILPTLLVILLTTLPSKTDPFTITKYLDKATTSSADNFVFTEYSKDFIFGLTSFGKGSYKTIASSSLSSNSFGIQNMNPFHYASCWKDSNECVFAGYHRIEYWAFENAEKKLKKVFTYGMTNLANANKFRVVKVIEGTLYFLAGDYANIGITRWKKSKDTEFYWYRTREDENGECQDMIVIPKTHFTISIFDEVRNLFIMDFTTMNGLATMSAGQNFNKGGRLAHITRHPTKYLIAGLQNENGGNTHMILYNYNDQSLARTIPAQTQFSSSYVIHGLAYATDTDYLLYAMESGTKGIFGLWRIDRNEAITGYHEETEAVVPQWATWLPAKNEFLVARNSGIVLITSDACSSDCKDTAPVFNSQCSSGILISGCTTCHDSSTPPCSAKTGEVGTIPSPKNPSDAEFKGDVLLAKSKEKTDVTDLFLAENNLVSIRDEENKNAEIIGLVCTILFIISIILLWSFLCMRRYVKKRDETGTYNREMSRKTKPLWEDEELNSELTGDDFNKAPKTNNESNGQKLSMIDNKTDQNFEIENNKNLEKGGEALT